MKLSEVAEKQMSHKEFYELFLFADTELLKKLETGMPVDDVKVYLKSKIPHNIKNRTGLEGDIDYTGSMPRRFRRYGFELEANENGTRGYIMLGGKKTWRLKPGGSTEQQKEQREAFPKKVVVAFNKRGTRCALSHTVIDGRPQIDHRIPIQRTKREEKFDEDIPEAVIHATFMPVSANANMKKKETCNRCVISGERPGGTYKASIPFWYEGKKEYKDTGSPGSGCKGCYWAYPEAWEKALVEHLHKTHSVT